MSLMLVNPRRRGRTAAQKAATKRMLAANRSKRSANPKRRKAKRHVARRSNPIGLSRITRHVRRHKRRSNPLSLSGMSGVSGMLMNGLKGAGGAIVVNAVTNYLPDAVKAGKLVYVTRAAIAIVIGTAGRKVLGNSARQMAEGALTVNFHDFINSMVGTMLPGSQLHGVGEYLGMQGVNNQNRALRYDESAPTFEQQTHALGEYVNIDS